MNELNHQKNIRILQHNCAKSTNAMTSCLEFEIKKADIILIQESGIEQNQITIAHPAFNCIMPKLDELDEHKPRVLTFVSKTFKLNVTSRPDISSDTDIQALSISGTNIDLLIFNIYNEKSQKPTTNEYTIDRKLTSIDLIENSIICGDFNAHHQWWNSKITNSIRSNALIDGLNKFECELINIPDEFTFFRGESKSVIDLTFATLDIARKIINGGINDEATTESDHEVIQFEIQMSKNQTYDNLTNGTYNIQKADWEKFESHLKSNYQATKIRMNELIQSNLDEAAAFLRDTISDAADRFILKRRPCENSKVWWSEKLTTLRK